MIKFSAKYRYYKLLHDVIINMVLIIQFHTKGDNKMTLKINSMYKTDTGYIVPRSHFKDEKGVKWCVVQVLEQHETTFKTYHTTMAQKEIKDALGLGKNERVEIV